MILHISRWVFIFSCFFLENIPTDMIVLAFLTEVRTSILLFPENLQFECITAFSPWKYFSSDAQIAAAYFTAFWQFCSFRKKKMESLYMQHQAMFVFIFSDLCCFSENTFMYFFFFANFYYFLIIELICVYLLSFPLIFIIIYPFIFII